MAVPAAIAGAGDTAVRRFLEFFAATIRNKNTRMAYYRAVTDFFAWLDAAGIVALETMVDRLAGEYGIRVAIHDHPKPARYWDPEHTYDVIKDLKNVGYCADLGHWKRSGLEPVVVLEKYGDRVFSSHFKDLVPNAGGKGGWHDVPWGTGESRAADMLAVLKQKGFHGPIAIEYETTWDVPTLQKCVDFFNEQANKLAQQSTAP